MEKLISEIEAFSCASGMSPELVLKKTGKYGWGVWAKWKAGESQCTLAMAEKIRNFIHSNSPSKNPALTADGTEGSLPVKKRKNASPTIQGPTGGAT